MNIDKLTDSFQTAINMVTDRFFGASDGVKRAAARLFVDELVKEWLSQPVVRFQYDRNLAPNGRIPEYKTSGSVGVDLVAVKDVTVPSLARALVPTGLHIELPEGYEAQVRPRSGLALKAGLTVLNSPGTIDSDYRGEVAVLLFNTSHADEVIKAGDRVAQLVVTRASQAQFVESEELSDTERGAGGWGSTGRR